MKKIRKPFYLKNKLFHQTKTNIWGLNQVNLEFKLNKKKWNFIRFAGRRGQLLPTFKFSPFSRNFIKRFNRFNFKNNLYFRKIVRLKYARLKNKELYRIFKKSNNFQQFISLLGSRLDVFLYRIFNKNKTIFSLRQLLSHKGILVNGRKVKNSNYLLKKFDVLSFKVSDLSNYFFFYQNYYERGYYICFVSYYLIKHIVFEKLPLKGKDLFISEVCSLLYPSYEEQVKKLVIGEVDDYFLNNNRIVETEAKLNFISIKEFIEVLNYKFLEKQVLLELHLLKDSLFYEGLLLEEINPSLGFFNEKKKGVSNFEFKFYKGYLDIIFLANFKEDYSINTNDKYLLHYLYY